MELKLIPLLSTNLNLLCKCHINLSLICVVTGEEREREERMVLLGAEGNQAAVLFAPWPLLVVAFVASCL